MLFLARSLLYFVFSIIIHLYRAFLLALKSLYIEGGNLLPMCSSTRMMPTTHQLTGKEETVMKPIATVYMGMIRRP